LKVLCKASAPHEDFPVQASRTGV